MLDRDPDDGEMTLDDPVLAAYDAEVMAWRTRFLRWGWFYPRTAYAPARARWWVRPPPCRNRKPGECRNPWQAFGFHPFVRMVKKVIDP